MSTYNRGRLVVVVVVVVLNLLVAMVIVSDNIHDGQYIAASASLVFRETV